LELLPPTIKDDGSLALLCEILRPGYTLEDTSALRAKLFGGAFSWQTLVDFAGRHGMLPPLIYALKERSLLLPLPRARHGENLEGHVSSRLAAAYAQHLARRDEQRAQLIEVLAGLAGGAVVPLLIKGARYLAEDCPAWCEARPMRDLDILIEPHQAEPAVEALRAVGYAGAGALGAGALGAGALGASGALPAEHHLPEMRKPGRHFPVELHTQALDFAGSKLLPSAQLWAVSVPGRLAEHEVRILPPAWHLLHALLHHQAGDRGYARRTLALKDLWEFSRQGSALAPEDWRAIADHLARGGGADMLGSWIVQAGQLFGLTAPAGVAISRRARAHAEATLRRAHAPYWLRRALFVGDKLRFAFAPETLMARYRLDPDRPASAAIAAHIGFLLRLHRGNLLKRMTGRRDHMS
jgi:hypothetical protein